MLRLTYFRLGVRRSEYETLSVRFDQTQSGLKWYMHGPKTYAGAVVDVPRPCRK